jgi:adenylylsulfate kinase-like enzyme
MPDTGARACIWMTGRRGAGKSTIASGVVDALLARGQPAVLIDNPAAATHLRDGGGALAWLCELLVTSGVIAVVAVDQPDRNDRELLRPLIPGFVEVFVDDGSEGDDAYEAPFAPEVRVPTADRDAAASTALVVSWLESADLVR